MLYALLWLPRHKVAVLYDDPRRRNLESHVLDKRGRMLLIVLVVLIAMAAIWFGTVLLQRPPVYPTAKTGIDRYLDTHRMDYHVTRADLASDVDALVGFTESLHADPFRVTTRAAFLETAGRIKADIAALPSNDIPAWQAFFLLQALAASLKDGHTTLFPVNWERSVPSLLPLTFISIDGRIFLRDDYAANGIPKRAEILAINGVPMTQMSQALMKYVPGTLPQALNDGLAEWLGFFIQARYGMQSPWRISWALNGRQATASVEGISYDAYLSATTSRKEYSASKIDADATTVPVMHLDFPGFNNSTWQNFKPFVDDFFARNSAKPYLVIDARHNHGGDGEWMIYLLSYLTTSLKNDGEFSFRVSPLNKRIVRYAIDSSYYDMHLPKFLWRLPLYKLVPRDDPYYWIGRGILESPVGSVYTARWARERAYMANPDAPRFHGKVYLLIGSETFSAGTYMAGLFKSNHLGTIVGRETGGRVSMLSDMRPVILPHTGLVYMVPVAKLIVNRDDPDRGVVPDVMENLTPDDYMKGRDPDMDAVRSLIEADVSARSGNR